MRVISGVRREVDENCALPGCCTASGGNFLPTIQESWPLKMGTIGCPETSLRNYHYSLRNNSEERSSQSVCVSVLKSNKFLFKSI